MSQNKAFRLLKGLYDVTRGKTEPVLMEEIATSLSEEDLKAAWHYLKDRGPHGLDVEDDIATLAAILAEF